MLSAILGNLSPSTQDANTRAFIARLTAGCLALAFVAVVLCEIYLAIIGKDIPPQINSLLYALAGGGLFSVGSHSVASKDTTNGNGNGKGAE